MVKPHIMYTGTPWAICADLVDKSVLYIGTLSDEDGEYYPIEDMEWYPENPYEIADLLEHIDHTAHFVHKDKVDGFVFDIPEKFDVDGLGTTRVVFTFPDHVDEEDITYTAYGYDRQALIDGLEA